MKYLYGPILLPSAFRHFVSIWPETSRTDGAIVAEQVQAPPSGQSAPRDWLAPWVMVSETDAERPTPMILLMSMLPPRVHCVRVSIKLSVWTRSVYVRLCRWNRKMCM